ncbi:hypothetical protein [Halorussus lipolyticus]|uniref:hypothetical protein n=1 Tax=Halorussus lipolyticus TaxID=3034024 RepID=UPI0023E7964C|nr:hypothetical protein [Halorussus sp. DT80]
MPIGPIEWFAKRILLEKVKHSLFPHDNPTEREIEDELYNTFVRDTEEFELTPPTGGEDEEPAVLNRPDEDIHGEIINLASGQDTTTGVTCVEITFDEAILNYLPPEERTENAIRFWFQKDDIDISFDENSRIGPLFSMYLPSTRKSNHPIRD